jgi:ribosome-interacting GTPase 1
LEGIWQELALVKIYTKKRGDQPDLTDPICMRRGSTIEVRLSSSCFASKFLQAQD